MTTRPDDEIIHRELDSDDDEPALQIVEIIAELEGKSVDELETTYDCLGHVLDDIFSNPPSPEAQLQVAFSYEGYRITVEQSGHARFVRA